jgi:hypothetical protein
VCGADTVAAAGRSLAAADVTGSVLLPGCVGELVKRDLVMLTPIGEADTGSITLGYRRTAPIDHASIFR